MNNTTSNSPADAKHLANLARLLEGQNKIYGSIDETMTRKRDAIVRGNLSDIEALDQTLESLQQKMKDMETERLSIMSAMGGEGKTLGEFAQGLPSDIGAPILALRGQLVGSIQQCQRAGRQTQDLLESSIRWISQSVQMVAEMLVPESAAYAPPGGAEHPTSTGHSTVQREA